MAVALSERQSGNAALSNEELVRLIQQGEKDKMLLLWENLIGLVKWKAKKIVLQNTQFDFEFQNVEFDDLYNSGYIALDKAVKTFDIARNIKFTTWFMYCLKSAFAEAGGYKSQKNALNYAKSLDCLVKGESSSGNGSQITLLETLADPDDKITAVDENLHNTDLHEAFEKAFDRINPRQAKVIKMIYYDRLTYDEIGKILNVSCSQAEDIKLRGFSRIRQRHRSLFSEFIGA